MHKRLLAILAMIATVFAFGVGAALAQQPEDPGTPESNPACEKENPPPGCADDGHPGDPDEEDPEEPGTPGPEALCEALGQIEPALGEVCQQLVDALTGGGGDPEPQPQPGLQDLCDGIRGNAPGELSPVADGCDEVVKAVEGGEGDPEPQPRPGLQDLCDGIRGNAPGELSPVADGCDELVGQLPA